MAKPSQIMQSIMRGESDLERAAPAIQSACRLPIYNAALNILKMPKGDRRAALDKLPDLIRPYIEAEVIRVFRMPI